MSSARPARRFRNAASRGLLTWFLLGALLPSFGVEPSSIPLDSVAGGNDPVFLPDNIDRVSGSVLGGKTVLFLGSSVTDGLAAGHHSFVDYLNRINGMRGIKDAVAGTTLADLNAQSYLSRLRQVNLASLDLFVCQLSTNDASLDVRLGEILPRNRTSFDITTTTGAIESIVSLVQSRWNCPIVFVTSPRFESSRYGALVTRLGELQKKWKFHVLDLWNNEEFNRANDHRRSLYMYDRIHPTMAGYLLLWTPAFERSLKRALRERP